MGGACSSWPRVWKWRTSESERGGVDVSTGVHEGRSAIPAIYLGRPSSSMASLTCGAPPAPPPASAPRAVLPGPRLCLVIGLRLLLLRLFRVLFPAGAEGRLALGDWASAMARRTSSSAVSCAIKRVTTSLSSPSSGKPALNWLNAYYCSMHDTDLLGSHVVDDVCHV